MTATPPAGLPLSISLADGDWHRLHPATPLLRGGIVFVAIIGFVIANLRERLLEMFVGAPEVGSDPLTELYERGAVGWALLAVLAVLIIVMVAFTLSWRMSSFRITDEAVEVRSGVLFRTHRKGRLDRVQGVNIARPFFARLFGAAKLEISVAGQDANIPLAYLRSSLADGLRRDVLRLASGARAPAIPPSAAAGVGTPDPSGIPVISPIGEIVGRRVGEFLAPELDPDAAPPESVVRITPGRLIGSLLLSGTTVFLIAAIIGIIVAATSGAPWAVIGLLPAVIAVGSVYISRFTKSLRYSIAGTSDGVRVGFGLLSTSNETLPPGRIHAIGISQPLLWRPFGWWQIRINKAGHSSTQGAAGQANTTTLPVGEIGDVDTVMRLILPAFSNDQLHSVIRDGMLARRGSAAYTGVPPKARWVRPFTWQRTGYTVAGGAVVFRRGAIWREVVVVPLARVQSVAVGRGPVLRMLGLAAPTVHTVLGPVQAKITGLDEGASARFLATVSEGAIQAAQSDTSHRWNRPAPDHPDDHDHAWNPSAADPGAISPGVISPGANKPGVIKPGAINLENPQ